jgi:hypothetical protein
MHSVNNRYQPGPRRFQSSDKRLVSAHRRRSDECHLGLIRAAGGGYYLLSAEGLLRGDAAVDDEPRAGHEGCVVRGEEHDALGDIVG